MTTSLLIRNTLAITVTAVSLTGCLTQSFQVPVEDRNNPPPVTESVSNEGVQVTTVTATGIQSEPLLEVERPNTAVNDTQVAMLPTVKPMPVPAADDPVDISDNPMAPPQIQAEPGGKPRNPAVVALLNTASSQKQRGDLRSAQASLERAQRIAPRDAEVYYQLADLRRRQQNYRQSEQLALRGLEVAQGQKGMQRALWRLIADSRQQRGDKSGAKLALRKAAQY